MTTRTKTKAALVAAMILAMSGPGLAQTSDDDHAAHHPEEDVTAPENGATMPGAGMPGMGMMTPEMMQMMMRMMGEGGMPGMMPGMMGGMPGGRMGDSMPGPGMMGSGRMGPGMMRQGMMPPVSMGGMPMGGMMQGHHGMMGGMMGGHGIGPGALYGIPHGETSEMTPARVEAFLSHLLERHGNPRLEIGAITQAEDGSIIAEIVTVDGSLVQRLAFNRYPGLFRQID